MANVCSICASTEGPFTQEPTGVTSSPFFIKCEKCNYMYPRITFEGNTKNPSQDTFEKYYYKCSGCGALFYKAIPYAFTYFGVRECPVCNHPFPSEEDIKFPNSTKCVMSNIFGRDTLEELEPLYEKLVEQQAKLSKAIDNIMLVKTDKKYDLWVVTKGSDGEIQSSLRPILLRITDNKLAFSISQLLKFAKKKEGLKIIKEIK